MTIKRAKIIMWSSVVLFFITFSYIGALLVINNFSLIAWAEEAVMTLTHQERYLRDMVEYAMWNGTTGSPSQWEGLRGHIDAYFERRD